MTRVILPGAVLSAVLFFLVTGGPSANGNDEQVDRTDSFVSPRDVVQGGPYCGVYALAACLHSIDVDVKVEDLIDPRYVGSALGSTAGELMRAATDSGATAELYQGLTHRELNSAAGPMLLHVRDGINTITGNHWVAFLGTDSHGRFRIINSPYSPLLLEPGELLAIWDGIGVTVRQKSEPAPGFDSFMDRGTRWLSTVLLVVIPLVMLQSLPDANSLPAGSAATTGSGFVFGKHVGYLLLVAFVIGTIQHWYFSTGFLRNSVSVNDISRRFEQPVFPEIKTAEVDKLIGQPDVTFIDARRKSAFRRGHIPGALSIPIDSWIPYRRSVLQQLDHNNHIVVYCKSENCRWADKIANFLAANGCRHVSVFRSGYVGWQSLQK